MSRPHILYLVPLKQRILLQDSETVTSHATAFGVDFLTHAASATLTSVARPSATERYDSLAEGQSVESVALPSASDFNEYAADADTITSIADAATADTEDAADLANVIGIGIILSGESFKGVSEDVNSIIALAIPTANDLYAGIDATVETALTQISAIETIAYTVEISTVGSIAILLVTDVAAYTDPSPESETNVTAVAAPSATESREYPSETVTIISTAVLATVDIHQYPVDAASITTIAIDYVALMSSPVLQSGINLFTEAADTAVFIDIETATITSVPSTVSTLGAIDGGPVPWTPDALLVPSGGLVIIGPPTGRAVISATDIYTP